MTDGELIALSEVPLFHSVDVLDLRRYFRESPLSPVHFSEGSRIAAQGDLYRELILVLEGKLTASMAAPDGKMILVDTLQAPCAVATAILFSSRRTLPVFLHAAETSRILKLPEALVLDLMGKYPSFLKGFLRENGDKLSFLTDKIRLFQFKSLRQKITAYLVMLDAGQGMKEVNLQYSREELAQLMGVARPSLSREISAMCREELISSRGKNVTILDRKSLLKGMEEV